MIGQTARSLLLPAIALAIASCGDSSVAPTVEPVPGGLPDDDPAEFTGYGLDGYAGDHEVTLYWDTTFHGDIGSPVPPPLAEVKIWISHAGPTDGFALAQAGLAAGPGSTVVANLGNGAPHFFRYTGHDEQDGVAVMSRPVWIEPGAPLPTSFSRPTPQRESGVSILPYARNVAWSPDGSRIAFVEGDAAGSSDVYLLDARDHSIVRVTETPAGWTADPAWSPSGGRLAYTQRGGGYRIATITPGDAVPTVISAGGVDFAPCWLSEDRVLFCKGQGAPPNIPELVTVDVATMSEHPVTTDFHVYKYSPTRPPDGSIVIISGFGRGELHGVFARSLYRVDLADGSLQRLTDNMWWDDVAPSWSRDGSRVFFGSDRNGHYEIWWFDPASGTTGQVTRAAERGVQHFNAAPSPDGRALACFRTEGLEASLEIMAIE